MFRAILVLSLKRGNVVFNFFQLSQTRIHLKIGGFTLLEAFDVCEQFVSRIGVNTYLVAN